MRAASTEAQCEREGDAGNQGSFPEEVTNGQWERWVPGTSLSLLTHQSGWCLFCDFFSSLTLPLKSIST